MSLLSNLNKKAANVKLTTTIGFNKRKDTIAEATSDSQTAPTETITEVTVAEVAEVSEVSQEQQSEETETVVTETSILKMLSQLEVSNNLKQFDVSNSLNRMTSLRKSGTSFLSSKTTITESQVELPQDSKLESVYIVLRPLKLAEAPEAGLKKLGRLVKAVEFENYLLLQHWGVLVGDRYYHLHTDDNKRLSVSLIPFIDVENDVTRHTIKIPIWRTHLSHDERVGVAVGVIKAMGDFKDESEVEITDENGKIITDPEDRKRFRMEGRYLRPPIPLSIFKGGYNPLSNNCIHFTKHYIFDQLLLRMNGVGTLASNIQWIVKKWCEMGYKKSPSELAKHLAGIFGVTNPFAVTPSKGAKTLIKILSIFLDIDYNPSLDEKPTRKPSDPEGSATDNVV